MEREISIGDAVRILGEGGKVFRVTSKDGGLLSGPGEGSPLNFYRINPDLVERVSRTAPPPGISEVQQWKS